MDLIHRLLSRRGDDADYYYFYDGDDKCMETFFYLARIECWLAERDQKKLKLLMMLTMLMATDAWTELDGRLAVHRWISRERRKL